MISQTFDKSTGVSELKCTDLPPRICLRVLASYKAVCLETAALVIGYFFWGAPSYGLFLLVLFVFFCIFIKALFVDVSIEEEY